jgi:chromosome segregation ATPase
MDSPKFTKSDPTVLLLNEIDILLAQTRLLELYLKQSQETAANETARIHEEYQAELKRLREYSAFADNEQSPAAPPGATGVRERHLDDPALQNELRQKQRLLESRDAELQSAKSETVILRERVAELEMVHQQAQAVAQEFAINRQDLQVELAALRHELEKNQHDFDRQQIISRALQEGLEEQLAKLQNQLRERQSSSKGVATELQQARVEIAALQGQVAELHASHHEIQATAARELEQTRVRFEAEIAGLQISLAERDRALQENETAVAELERSLKTDILTLRSQLEQKQELVEFRDDELRDAQRQLAALQQRIIELESADRSVVATAEEIERIRRSFDDELTALQREVAASEELAIRERQQAVAAVELALHSKIQALQEEQARSLGVIDERENELRSAHAEAAALRERISQLEAVTAADLTTRQLAEETRLSLEAELKSLHSSLAQKEYALKEQQDFLRSVEDRLGNEIDQLRSDLTQQRTAGESNNAELERLRMEIAELQERNTQAELTRHQLEEDRQHAAAHRQELEARLQAKDDELRAAQASAQGHKEAALREQERQLRSVEAQLSAEIARLHGQLEDRQKRSDQENVTLVQLRSQIVDLHERNEQSELMRRQTEENWQRAVASEQELGTSLRAIADELHSVQTKGDEFKAQFETAIGQLQLQLTEKGLLAESRAVEIGNLKAEVNRLSEQLAQREFDQTEPQVNFQREIESSHAAHQAEMATVHEEYRGKQHNLENELAQEKQNAAVLRNQIEERERLVDEAQSALRIREQDFEAATTEAAALRARLHELETSNQMEKAAAKTVGDQALNRLETELISLRSDLQQKTWALAQQQATMENVALAHKSQIQKLEAKLGEQQHGIRDRSLELEQAQSEARVLQSRIEELERELQHAQLTALSRTEQITQDYAARIVNLNSQLAQKTSVLQERDLAQSNIEHALRYELERLIREAEEKNHILQNRNDELVRVKAEMDSLQERFAQLELATSQTESALAGETERMHTELQARLALLQAELSQKEWALEERDAKARGLEQIYHEEIESLRKQLAEKEAAINPDGHDYVLGEPRLNQAEDERFQVFDGAQSNDHDAHQTAQSRRWHTGFAWKRRWKS